MAKGKKTGGRQAGRTNQATTDFRRRLQAYATRHKVDPHYFMVKMLADTTTHVLGTSDDGEPIVAPTVPLTLKVQCARELAQYLQPKLRSVELTGDADNPLTVLHALPDADLEARITRLLRQTGYAGGHAALPEGEDTG